ncbi:hypothetical protein COOONC_11205 [Cooperia oncophora]
MTCSHCRSICISSTTTLFALLRNRYPKGKHRQFPCSHKICGHCCSLTDCRKCLVCYASAGNNPFPPYMFLSPPHTDHSNELLDHPSLSLHSQSITSYQNGLTDSLHSLGLGELSGHLESFNLWDNRAKIPTTPRSSASQGIVLPETSVRTEEEHPPVFSPNSQLVNTTPAVTSPLSMLSPSNVATQRSMLLSCATCGENARPVVLSFAG